MNCICHMTSIYYDPLCEKHGAKAFLQKGEYVVTKNAMEAAMSPELFDQLNMVNVAPSQPIDVVATKNYVDKISSFAQKYGAGVQKLDSIHFENTHLSWSDPNSNPLSDIEFAYEMIFNKPMKKKNKADDPESESWD